jgi:hypothetical protein
MATYSKPKNTKPTPTSETTGKPVNKKELINQIIKRKTKEKFLTNNQKKYYKDNKETIMARKLEKFECECGGTYTRHHIQRHFRSKKHSDYILNREDAFLEI